MAKVGRCRSLREAVSMDSVSGTMKPPVSFQPIKLPCNRSFVGERNKKMKSINNSRKLAPKIHRLSPDPDSPNAGFRRRQRRGLCRRLIPSFPRRCAFALRWVGLAQRSDATQSFWKGRLRGWCVVARLKARLDAGCTSNARPPPSFRPVTIHYTIAFAIAHPVQRGNRYIHSFIYAKSSSHPALPLTRLFADRFAFQHTTLTPTDWHSLCQSDPWSSGPPTPSLTGLERRKLARSAPLS